MDTQVTVSRLPLNVPTYQNQYKGHVSCGKWEIFFLSRFHSDTCLLLHAYALHTHLYLHMFSLSLVVWVHTYIYMLFKISSLLADTFPFRYCQGSFLFRSRFRIRHVRYVDPLSAHQLRIYMYNYSLTSLERGNGLGTFSLERSWGKGNSLWYGIFLFYFSNRHLTGVKEVEELLMSGDLIYVV